MKTSVLSSFTIEIMNTSSVINPRTHWINARFSRLTSWLPSLHFVISLVVFGLIANITICFVMLRGGRLKKHLSNFMLFHLSITGIAYRLIVVPSQWAALFYPFLVKPTMLCKFRFCVMISRHYIIMLLSNVVEVQKPLSFISTAR